MLKRDNVVSPEAEAEGRTLAAMGLEPRAIESIVPTYLYRFRKHGQFDPRQPPRLRPPSPLSFPARRSRAGGSPVSSGVVASRSGTMGR